MKYRIQIVMRGPYPRSGSYYEEARFAEELSRHLDSPVAVVEDAESAVATDAILLLFASEPSAWMCALDEPRRTEILERVFLVQGQRVPRLLMDVEEHKLAGAIESSLYHQWLGRRDTTTGYGLVGLRSIVQRLGGDCTGGPFTTERYCVFDDPQSHNLTSALARYLREFSNAREQSYPFA